METEKGMENAELDLCALTAADLGACAEVFVEAFGGSPWNEPWTWEQARRRLAEALGTPAALGVAARRGPAVGFALGFGEQGYDGRVFYLKEMAVRPAWQRRGVGRALLRQLEERARQRGYRHLYLLTRRGTPALGFYRGAGFRESARAVLLSKGL